MTLSEWSEKYAQGPIVHNDIVTLTILTMTESCYKDLSELSDYELKLVAHPKYILKKICVNCGGWGGCPGSDFGDYGYHPCYACGN